MPTANADRQTLTEDLKKWDQFNLWHAFTQMDDYEPFVVESADGIWLTDIEGRTFLDGVSSLWCLVHGHRNPAIDQAIIEQINKVSHVTLLGSSCSTTVKLAKKLAEITPGDLQHVFFGSDGASAVEAALKIAYQYWQQRENPVPTKTRFMALELAYHGDTIGSVSLGGVDKFHKLFEPLLFDVIRLASPHRMGYQQDENDAQILSAFIQQMRPIFAENHQQTAAVIIEPLMQGAAGMIPHPRGLLSALRQLCDEFGILLIADEVAVGFGRTGKLFACEHEDVVPDLLCIGKGLTGGYLPLSATIATAQIFQAFLGGPENTLFHGHTYGGNPLAAAAALANIELFQADGFWESLKPAIERISKRRVELEGCPGVHSSRQVGMMCGIELADSDPQSGKKICLKARESNVLLRPLGNTVVVMPPLVTKPNEIDLIFDAIAQALND